LLFGHAGLELARVAAIAGNVPKIQAKSALACRWLFESQGDSKRALIVVVAAPEALEAASMELDLHLVRLAIECAELANDVLEEDR
jgi:hypothetical protein